MKAPVVRSAPTAIPVAPRVALFQENFQGERVLPTGQSKNGACTFDYVNGAYLIDATGGAANPSPCHQALPNTLPANVRIEMDVSAVDGSALGAVGLGFGKVGGEFYYFPMDSKGQYFLSRCASECGYVESLTSPEPGTVLKGNGAVNVLAVEIRGPEITVFANGKRLSENRYVIERAAAGQAVMWVSGGGKAAFHALRVFELSK